MKSQQAIYQQIRGTISLFPQTQLNIILIMIFLYRKILETI